MNCIVCHKWVDTDTDRTVMECLLVLNCFSYLSLNEYMNRLLRLGESYVSLDSMNIPWQVQVVTPKLEHDPTMFYM